MTAFFIGFLCLLLALVSLLLIGIILMQDSKSGGLSSAFGGAGMESNLGTSGQQGITRFTVILSVIFFVLCMGVGKLSQQQNTTSELSNQSELKSNEGSGTGGTGTTPENGQPGSDDQGSNLPGGLRVEDTSGGAADSAGNTTGNVGDTGNAGTETGSGNEGGVPAGGEAPEKPGEGGGG